MRLPPTLAPGKRCQPRGCDDIKELAADLRVPVPYLLALSRNNDPFYCGTPADRQAAEWFASLWGRFAFPRGVHLRRIHYVLASQKNPVRIPDGNPYRNTQGCWATMTDASKAARHLGLVDVAAFADHRNPDPHVFAADLREPAEPAWHLDTEPATAFWPQIAADLGGLPLDLPEIVVGGYDYDAGDQPFHLELWVEKSTMNDVLVPVCRRRGVNLVTGAGFQSITGVIRMLERVARLPPGKAARVWYISDFDPAGDQMPVAVARQIEFYLERFAPGADLKLTPMALTKEQVLRYDLPRIPIKDNDTRKGDFEGRHGEGAVELDALEALHPGVLASLVEEAVSPYRDETLEDRLADAHDEAQDEADQRWQDATAGQGAALDELKEEAKEITDRYRGRLTDLNNQLQADLAPLKGRAKAVRRAIHDIASELTIELPDRPDAETDAPDEDDWLYDSSREYLEQIESYQAYKGGKSLGDRTQKCEACGEEFRPLRANARYCSSEQCKSRVARARAAKNAAELASARTAPNSAGGRA
jgi:hypothetical protein